MNTFITNININIKNTIGCVDYFYKFFKKNTFKKLYKILDSQLIKLIINF